MNISATFIRKPIATALLMAAILLLGMISYELLPVAALPNIDTPTVMVTAQLPGADAQTVASTVTTPLERQFGHLERSLNERGWAKAVMLLDQCVLQFPTHIL